MKKLLMIVALVGMVFTGYSKTNAFSTDVQAQKPTITLWVTGDAFNHTITLHASSPVPETVDCEGQYQAPNNTTGYWIATLIPGATEVTLSSNITESPLVDLGMVYAGGQRFNVALEMGGSFETANAIYNCTYMSGN